MTSPDPKPDRQPDLASAPETEPQPEPRPGTEPAAAGPDGGHEGDGTGAGDSRDGADDADGAHADEAGEPVALPDERAGQAEGRDGGKDADEGRNEGEGEGEGEDAVDGAGAVPRVVVEPPSPDRVYRSGGGLAGGVVVLALAAWLGIDAVVSGEDRTPWLALAGMLFLVPLVIAYTLRPAVYANDQRLRIRNPFRNITLPWAAVSGLRSGYSNEVFDQAGTKYQLWAVPVSLRARKKAGRAQTRATHHEQRAGAVGSRGRGPGLGLGGGAAGSGEPPRARADKTMDDLRELQEAGGTTPQGQGEPDVRWAWEVAAPALAGLVLLAVLLAVG